MNNNYVASYDGESFRRNIFNSTALTQFPFDV